MITTRINEPCSPKLVLEAAEWRLLALLLERPVSGWARDVAVLAAEVCDEQLRSASHAAQTVASQGLYDTTFGPGGPAAPREISYRAGLDAGACLAELAAFYSAFAFQSDRSEPPDHVAIEAGFIAYLKLKELYARARGQNEEAAVTADAAERFITDHLAMLAEPLAQSLERSGIGYLSLTAASLLRRVGPRRENDVATETDDSPSCGCSAL
jgi:nitrate reductase assembly molybdenum cofactor insertion protein NarJ